MEKYFQVTLVSVIVLICGLAISLLITLTQIHEENTNAVEDIEQHDYFIKGYDILVTICDGEGIPGDWIDYDDPGMIGILTNYNPDDEKISTIVNMSNEKFESFFPLDGINYTFELRRGDEVLMSRYVDIPESSAKVIRYIDDDRVFIMYLWK